MGVCGLLSIVCVFGRNFFLCLHVDIISILLLSKQFLFSSFKIQNFSFKHKLHRVDPPVYEIARFKRVSTPENHGQKKIVKVCLTLPYSAHGKPCMMAPKYVN